MKQQPIIRSVAHTEPAQGNSSSISGNDVYISPDSEINLVENSGIQFVDYQVEVDWDCAENFKVKGFSKGQFLFENSGEDSHLIRAVPDIEGRTFSDPVSGDVLSSPSKITCDTRKSLTLYNGVWFPLPYFSESGTGPSNWARARVVKIPLNEEQTENAMFENEDRCRYHVTLAFDTELQNIRESEYYAPTPQDVSNKTRFSLNWQTGGTAALRKDRSGQSWVEEWARSVFLDLARDRFSELKRAKDDKFLKLIENREHEAHYLNMLAFLGGMVEPNRISFIANRDDGISGHVDVDLILDIGNSRSCGVLYEEVRDGSTEDFTKIAELSIRDLNAPETVYTEPFPSRIEFQVANFDFDGHSARSGRPDAFIWPSFGRTGNEATILSGNREGGEGRTGLNSPKRYLWKSEADSNEPEWYFNPFRYQIPFFDAEEEREALKVKYTQLDDKAYRAYARPVSDYVNSSGMAVFVNPEENDQNMLSKFSYRSTMTFMLQEIFLHALVQINSVYYRQKKENSVIPRRLKSIVLTTPPSMSDLEKESFRACVYEALGILWKCMHYDKEKVTEFDFLMDPKDPECQGRMVYAVPSVVMDLDEAQAGQYVYLYNEIVLNYGGDARHFIEELRRTDADGRFAEELCYRGRNSASEDMISARIASIDIGGGTTDLVISDYAFSKSLSAQSRLARQHEILREGFKIAGDDIVLNIIQTEILGPLEKFIEQHIKEGCIYTPKELLYAVFALGGNNSVQFKTRRALAVQQVLIKVAQRIISCLEALDSKERGQINARACGTILQFIKGTFDSEGIVLDKIPYKLPSEEIITSINHVNNEMPLDANVTMEIKNAKGETEKIPFNILLFRLDIDLYELNRRFVTGEREAVTGALDRLCAIVDAYRADVLLLTGRPSKIPGLRQRIFESLPMSSARIIPMHKYRCGSWYPLTKAAYRIGDPKTTVAVGALVAYMRRTNEDMRFNVDPFMPQIESPVRFLGFSDNRGIMHEKTDVLYRFKTQTEKKKESKESSSVNSSLDLLYGAPKSSASEGDKAKPFDPSFTDSMVIVKGEESKKGFFTKLTAYLGYRQFANDTFPATQLYTIEALRDKESSEEIKAARSIYLEDGAPLESLMNRLSDRNAKADLMKLIQGQKDEEVRNQEDIENQKKSLETALSESVKSELSKNDKGGIFKMFSRRQDSSEDAERLYRERYHEAVEIPLEEFIREHGLSKNTLKRKVSDILNANFKAVEKEVSERLRQLNSIIANAEFKVELSIAEDEDYPQEYRFVKDCFEKAYGSDPEVLSKYLPSVIVLKVSSISAEGEDYDGYVNLRLKTVVAGDEESWIDSGVVLR